MSSNEFNVVDVAEFFNTALEEEGIGSLIIDAEADVGDDVTRLFGELDHAFAIDQTKQEDENNGRALDSDATLSTEDVKADKVKEEDGELLEEHLCQSHSQKAHTRGSSTKDKSSTFKGFLISQRLEFFRGLSPSEVKEYNNKANLAWKNIAETSAHKRVDCMTGVEEEGPVQSAHDDPVDEQMTEPSQEDVQRRCKRPKLTTAYEGARQPLPVLDKGMGTEKALFRGALRHTKMTLAKRMQLEAPSMLPPTPERSRDYSENEGAFASRSGKRRRSTLNDMLGHKDTSSMWSIGTSSGDTSQDSRHHDRLETAVTSAPNVVG